MNPSTAPSARRSLTRQRGASLIEASISLAVVGILVSLSVPDWSLMRDRKHLEGASAQFEVDLQWARSLAVARGDTVRIGFESADNHSCYVIHTGPAGACRCADDGVPSCSADAVGLRQVQLQPLAPVSLTSNVRSMLFDGVRGTVTPTATVQLRMPEGPVVRHVVNLMGRVRTCATPALGNHVAC